MNYSKQISLIFLCSLLVAPFVTTSTVAQESTLDADEWDYQGVISQQKYRLQILLSYEDDPYQTRTFVYCLDSDGIPGIDTLVALIGIQPIRNAPQYSAFFETTSVGGTYGFALRNDAISWITVDENVMDVNSSMYDEVLAPIYEEIEDKVDYGYDDIYDGDTDRIIYPIHFAKLNSIVGSVGDWQQINRDQTIINGNFTTYGLESPLYRDPQDPDNEDLWWPDYNVTIAQNFQRSSLPRTHSFNVDFPFIASLSAFGAIILVLLVSHKIRRKKQ